MAHPQHYTPTENRSLNRSYESGCNLLCVSAVGKMREEVYDIHNPIMHVGTRLGRIRDNPDKDNNYYNPGNEIFYQSSYLLCLAEYLFPQMPSLAKVTGVASLRFPRGQVSASGCWQIPQTTASAPQYRTSHGRRVQALNLIESARSDIVKASRLTVMPQPPAQSTREVRTCGI